MPWAPALTGGPQLLSPDALPGVFQLGVGVKELTNLDLARLHVVDYKRSIWICHQCVLDLWPRWFGDRDQRPTFEGPLGCQYRWWEDLFRCISMEQHGWVDHLDGPWNRWSWRHCQRRAVFRHRPY